MTSVKKELHDDNMPSREFNDRGIRLFEDRRMSAIMADVATYSLSGKELDFTFADLISQQELLEAFADDPSALYSQNSWLWEKNIRALIDTYTPASGSAQPPVQDQGEALLMCENRSSKNLGITTLSLLHDEEVRSLHIITNGKQAMMVGETMPDSLVKKLEAAGIRYVSRHDPDAGAQAQAAAEAVVGEPPQSYTYNRLEEAFRYRNCDEEQARKQQPLNELLTDAEIDPTYNKYVVRSFIPPSELDKYRLLDAAGNMDTGPLQAILEAHPGAVHWKVGDMNVTPLMIAARDGNHEGIRLLMAAGADINAQDGHGKTALGWAMQDPDNYRAAMLLKELGARLDIPDYWSKTPEEGFKDMTQIKVLKPLRLKLPKGRSI